MHQVRELLRRISTHPQMKDMFGEFRGLFVFAYETDQPARFPELAPFFCHDARYYAFYGVWVDEYAKHIRLRSRSWKTVDLATEDFRDLRFRLDTFLIPEEDSVSSNVKALA